MAGGEAASEDAAWEAQLDTIQRQCYGERAGRIAVEPLVLDADDAGEQKDFLKAKGEREIKLRSRCVMISDYSHWLQMVESVKKSIASAALPDPSDMLEHLVDQVLEGSVDAGAELEAVQDTESDPTATVERLHQMFLSALGLTLVLTEDDEWRDSCSASGVIRISALLDGLWTHLLSFEDKELGILDPFSRAGVVTHLARTAIRSSTPQRRFQTLRNELGEKPLQRTVEVTSLGLRLFAAPVNYAPPEAHICRSPEQRAVLRSQGVTWAWCALAALRGASVATLATQAFIAATVFLHPPESLQQAAALGMTAEPLEFKMGKLSARSVLRRPLVDAQQGPTRQRALDKLLQQDELLRALLDRGAQTDFRLEGWEKRITPPPLDEIPEQLLSDLPSFSDPLLRSVELPNTNAPYRLPWVPLQPPQPTPSFKPPMRCPRPTHMLLPAARQKMETWVSLLHRLIAPFVQKQSQSVNLKCTPGREASSGTVDTPAAALSNTKNPFRRT
ncbi:hypothetical protein AB1Y20_012130 [Prymnesium parvum]|uniref:Uncharacterized protein n=1 Tax=Prymnesium parvum TaxID=97485 RepID=A0AB34IQC1_PRYPA